VTAWAGLTVIYSVEMSNVDIKKESVEGSFVDVCSVHVFWKDVYFWQTKTLFCVTTATKIVIF
jgi:hypothetical protein